jgi:hypothetical protein
MTPFLVLHDRDRKKSLIFAGLHTPNNHNLSPKILTGARDLRFKIFNCQAGCTANRTQNTTKRQTQQQTIRNPGSDTASANSKQIDSNRILLRKPHEKTNKYHGRDRYGGR